MLDQAKMVMKLRKLQKEIASETMEVQAGNGAVTVKISGEQKIKKISINPEQVDLDDIIELERWVEQAVSDAIAQSQSYAAEKMKPLMGQLSKLGLG